MSFNKVLLLVSLCCCLSKAHSVEDDEANSSSETTIEVFNPEGFAISVDDVPGVTRVVFYININKTKSMDDSEPVVVYKIVRRKRDGKWTFVNRKVKLEIGDVVNYRYFLITENSASSRHGRPFVVKELIPLYRRKTCKCKPATDQPPPCKPTEEPTTPQPPTSPPSTEKYDDELLNSCNQMMVNATRTLILMRSQMEELKKLNRQLMGVVESYPDAKKLRLSGSIPPDEETSMVVKFILHEKLDLKPKIISAVRNSDNSIEFEVETLDEKFEILEQAKEKLRYSRIIIS